MPATQEYDTSQLETVQHPTLGPLKFPKDMPYDERNEHVEELETRAKNLPGATTRLLEAAGSNPKLATMAKPTQFEQEKPGHGPTTTLAGVPLSTEGTGSRAWEGIKGIGGAIANQLDPTSGLSGAGLTAIGLNPRSGTASDRLNEIPIVQAAKEAKAGWERPTDVRAKIGEAATSGLGAFLGMSGEEAARHAERGETGEILGQAVVPAAAAIGGELARIPAVRRTAGSVADVAGAPLTAVRERVGGAIHDPVTGDLTKGAQTMSQATGAAIGGTAGGLLGSLAGHPGMYVGGATGVTAGGLAGPALVERAFPEPAARVAAREKFLKDKIITEAQEGAAKENRAREIAQKRIETQNEAKLREAEQARQKELADAERLKEQHAQSLMRRGKEQEAIESKKNEGLVGRIIQPGAEPSEGRPATWTDETTQMLARFGDPDAIAQIRNRLKGVDPLNPGRIPLNYPTVETTPKSVTRFNESGQAIEEPVAPREGQELIGGVPILNPPVTKPTPSVRATPRIVQAAAAARGGEIPQVPAKTMPLNFERPIKVPSESPTLLKPEAPEDIFRPAKPGEESEAERLIRNPTREATPPTEEEVKGAQERKETEEAERRLEERGVAPGKVENMKKPENVLPGMAEHVAKQEEGAARVKGEELFREIRTPKSIESQAGEMETKSPLFRGTEASPQHELLKPMEKPVEREPGEEEAEPAEVKAKGAAKAKAKPIEQRYGRDEIIEAEGRLAEESGAMLAADRPGVYFDEYTEETKPLTQMQNFRKGERAGGKWRGQKSGRDMYPFMRAHPDINPQAVQKALRNKDSAAYTRYMEKAIEFNRRQKMTPEERAAEADKMWEGFVPSKEKYLKLD
jgi:hypothetical protein